MQAQTNFYIIVKRYVIVLLNCQLHSNQTSESGLKVLFHSKQLSWTQEERKVEKSKWAKSLSTEYIWYEKQYPQERLQIVW